MEMPRVHIGRLSYNVREKDIQRFFSGYGCLLKIDLKKGYVFVEFKDRGDAGDAVYGLNGRELCGEHVIVEHVIVEHVIVEHVIVEHAGGRAASVAATATEATVVEADTAVGEPLAEVNLDHLYAQNSGLL
ncbi:hypothetical protein EI555_020680 [Monodon monoceros]|uniref:RRM domain-containing protein n=1 Tax=Monodon monoceros TaxID=40151 RepID=A0A4U1FDT7_MONMO|nr:hypothetical protein EI555_020680 [Monodon monoceros]